jgi:hypothetical protein
MDHVRQLIKRSVPLTTKELIAELQPILRGWAHYYEQAHVRTLFHRLDGWTVHLPRGRAKLAARRYPAGERGQSIRLPHQRVGSADVPGHVEYVTQRRT